MHTLENPPTHCGLSSTLPDWMQSKLKESSHRFGSGNSKNGKALSASRCPCSFTVAVLDLLAQLVGVS